MHENTFFNFLIENRNRKQKLAHPPGCGIICLSLVQLQKGQQDMYKKLEDHKMETLGDKDDPTPEIVCVCNCNSVQEQDKTPTPDSDALAASFASNLTMNG